MFSKKRKELIDVLKIARKEGFAIGQFNLSSLEQLKGVVRAAKETGKPVICGTSPKEADYFAFHELVPIVRSVEQKEGISIYLNYDHGKDIGKIKNALMAGYDMVHFDGSHLSIEENTKIAKEIVSFAKKKGALVEGEISKISGKSVFSEEEIEETTLTPVEKVVKFVKESGVNCIAFDVGSFHGVHKNKPTIYPERVSELLRIINSFVVLHGGSGINDETISELIKRGVVKININTELRFEWRDALYKTLLLDEKEIVPYNILPSVVEAVYKKTKEKINLFNYYEQNNS
jgi:fructose-bisphosphate aldolase, class II